MLHVEHIEPPIQEKSMISEVLQKLVDDGQLNKHDFIEATNLDGSTFYRWLTGETQPGVNGIVALIKHSKCHSVKLALLGAIMPENYHCCHVPAALDIDGDGDVDTDDALAALGNSIKRSGEIVAEIATYGVNNKRHLDLDDSIFDVIGQLHAVSRIVNHLHKFNQPRKRAGALSISV